MEKNECFDAKLLRARLKHKPIVLVGLMGCGKSSIGKRLAQRLGLNFVDSDHEIENAIGYSIPEMFERHGEPFFRALEVRTISKLILKKNYIIATGGGAFINDETRARLTQNALTIWLKADFETTMKRVSRRPNRPLLKTANPEQTLRDLMQNRYPIYAQAQLTLQSKDAPHEVMVEDTLSLLRENLGLQPLYRRK